jgi:malonate transporter
MPDPALLLLPDFLLIVVGLPDLPPHRTRPPGVGRAERLVYWLLFPVLLFTAIVRSPLRPAASLSLGAGRLGGGGRRLCAGHRAAPRCRGSTRGCMPAARRCLPLQLLCGAGAGRAHGGSEGVAGDRLLVSLCVPLCNVGAVWPLARHGGQNTLRELLRNPLILATVAGLVANLAGLRLPALADTRWAASARPRCRWA